jgi:hypothetical protein
VGDLKLLVPCFVVRGINGSNVTAPILNASFAVDIPQGGDDGKPFDGVSLCVAMCLDGMPLLCLQRRQRLGLLAIDTLGVPVIAPIAVSELFFFCFFWQWPPQRRRRRQQQRRRRWTLRLLIHALTHSAVYVYSFGRWFVGSFVRSFFRSFVRSVGHPAHSLTGPATWPMLFNLSADESESVNIAHTSPELVAQLMARLQVLAETMVEPMQWFPPFQARPVLRVFFFFFFFFFFFLFFTSSSSSSLSSSPCVGGGCSGATSTALPGVAVGCFTRGLPIHRHPCRIACVRPPCRIACVRPPSRGWLAGRSVCLSCWSILLRFARRIRATATLARLAPKLITWATWTALARRGSTDERATSVAAAAAAAADVVVVVAAAAPARGN